MGPRRGKRADPENSPSVSLSRPSELQPGATKNKRHASNDPEKWTNARRKREQRHRMKVGQEQVNFWKLRTPELSNVTHIHSDALPGTVLAELKEFMISLNSLSSTKDVNPGTLLDIYSAELQSRGQRGKKGSEDDDGFKTLKTAMAQRSSEKDIDVATTVEELTTICDTIMTRPVLIPRESPLGISILQGREFPSSILEFLETLDDEARLEIQDYDRPIESSDTAAGLESKFTTVRELKERQNNPESRGSPYNSLDIALRTQECPIAGLSSSDYLHKLNLPEHDLSRGVEKPYKDMNFMLLSEKGCISGTHVDPTLITGLTPALGSKIWYFGRGVASLGCHDAARFAGLGGLEPEGYLHGWSRLRLRQGDTIVMPPGIEHAVYTPEDSLVVGRFYALPRQMATSLHTLCYLLENPHCTNDHIPLQIIEGYRRYYQDLERRFRSQSEISVDLRHDCQNFAWALQRFCKIDKFDDSITSVEWQVNRKSFAIEVKDGGWAQRLLKLADRSKGSEPGDLLATTLREKSVESEEPHQRRKRRPERNKGESSARRVRAKATGRQ